MTSHMMTLQEAYLHYNTAHSIRYGLASLSLIVNGLTMHLIIKMKLYKSRLMAIVFWMNVCQICYDLSMLPLCGNPPAVVRNEDTIHNHNPVAEHSELEPYVDCKTGTIFVQTTADLAMGLCTNFISCLVAYVITLRRSLQISQIWMMCLILLPAATMGVLVAQEYRQVQLDETRDGKMLYTLLDSYDAIELGTLVINFVAIALVTNTLSKLGYEGVFGFNLSSSSCSCSGNGNGKNSPSKDNPNTHITHTHRQSVIRDSRYPDGDINCMRAPSVVVSPINGFASRAQDLVHAQIGAVRFGGPLSSETGCGGSPHANARLEEFRQSIIQAQAQQQANNPSKRSKSVTVTTTSQEIPSTKSALAKHAAPLPLFDLAKRLVWYPIVGSVAVCTSALYHLSQRTTIDQYVRTVVLNENPVQQTIQFYLLTIVLPLCGISYGCVFVSIQRGAWELLKRDAWELYCYCRYCGKVPPGLLPPAMSADDTDGKSEKRPKLIRTVTTHRSIRINAGAGAARSSVTSPGGGSTKQSVSDTRDSRASANDYDGSSKSYASCFDENDQNPSYFDDEYGSSAAAQNGYDYEYNEDEDSSNQADDDEYYSDSEEIEERWDFDQIDDLEAYIGKAAEPDKIDSSSDMNVDIELASVATSQTAGINTNIPVDRGPVHLGAPSLTPSAEKKETIIDYGPTNSMYNIAVARVPNP